MITLQEFCRYLDELLQPQIYSDYCTNGLQVEGKAEVQSIAVAVSASLKAIQFAVDNKVDLLLVHHGMFWKGDTMTLVGITGEKAGLLLRHGISLVAYHLPLDAHREYGNNWRAAQELGWKNLEPFSLVDKQPIGVKGTFPPIHQKEFSQQLSSYYHRKAEHVFGGKEYIESAALISGGAHKYLVNASSEGLDAFITGTRDEPTWHQAFEQKINFYSVGHSASEVIGPRALAEHVSYRFGLECHTFWEDNPF